MNRFRCAVFACAVGLFAIGPVRANVLALEFDPAQSSLLSAGAQYTMGWKFTTTSAITVVALDAYDPEPGSGHVWLYDSLDDVLATAIVSLSDAMVGAPQAFYSHSVTPVTLAAGQTYYIAEDYDGTAAAFPQFYANVGSLTTASQIQYGGGTLASGLDQFPTHDSLFGGTTNPAYFGPNFEIAPEPSTLALGAGALVGLAVLRRRKVHGKVR